MGTIRRQPELLPDLVTELLRLMPPLLTVKCVARCEAVIGDVTVPAGGSVYVAPGAANRDPAMFERPDELSLHRPPPHPIVFGVSAGAQPCVGEGLACLVAATVFNVLLTEFPPLLAAQPLTSIVFTNHRIWEDFMVLRAPYRLMVTFGGVGATH
jgi:cytochrome P450